MLLDLHRHSVVSGTLSAASHTVKVTEVWNFAEFKTINSHLSALAATHPCFQAA